MTIIGILSISVLLRARALEAIAWLGTYGPGPVDVEALGEKLGAEIVFEDLEGAKARVIQIGDRARIIISTRIVGIGAIWFSIAHEIAHLLLKHYLRDGDLGRAFKRQRTCSPRDSDGSTIERDASVFATELLMPSPLVTPMCLLAPKSLDPIRAIASAFQTSMYASARRFVELMPERCAVVITKQGRVQWVQKSPSFSAWSPEGRSVNPASAAFDYFDGGKLDEPPRVIPASTWCSRESLGSDPPPVHEHATAIPETGTAAVDSGSRLDATGSGCHQHPTETTVACRVDERSCGAIVRRGIFGSRFVRQGAPQAIHSASFCRSSSVGLAPSGGIASLVAAGPTPAVSSM